MTQGPIKLYKAGWYPDLDGEVFGSRSGHTKVFKIGTYCSLAYAGHNKLE